MVNASRPRFLVMSSEPVDLISAKLYVYKAFKIYPSTEDVEISVRPEYVPPQTVQVADRQEIAKEVEVVIQW